MDFFGPLDAKFCNVFMIGIWTTLILMFLLVVSTFYLIFKRKITGIILFYSIMLFASYFIGYIQSRIFYNMCLSNGQM